MVLRYIPHTHLLTERFILSSDPPISGHLSLMLLLWLASTRFINSQVREEDTDEPDDHGVHRSTQPSSLSRAARKALLEPCVEVAKASTLGQNRQWKSGSDRRRKQKTGDLGGDADPISLSNTTQAILTALILVRCRGWSGARRRRRAALQNSNAKPR